MMSNEEWEKHGERMAEAVLKAIDRKLEGVQRTLSDFEKRLSAVEAKSAKGAAR